MYFCENSYKNRRFFFPVDGWIDFAVPLVKSVEKVLLIKTVYSYMYSFLSFS